MKKYLFTIFLLIPLLAGAQEYTRALEQDFVTYVDHIIAKEFDQAMDYTYDKFFTLIPREKFVEMMNATFNDPSIEYEMERAEVTDIGSPELIGDEFFVLLKYKSVIRMKFVVDTASETQEEFEQRMKLTRLSLEQVFGAENVYYEAETGFYQLSTVKNVCAVSDNGETGWQFVVLEKEQLDFLRQILPEGIIDRVN